MISAGSSSRDLALSQTVQVDAPRILPPLTRESTLQEWLADPVGRQLLEREVAAGQHGEAMQDGLVELIGNFPMSALANLQLSLGHDSLDLVVEEWTGQQS